MQSLRQSIPAVHCAARFPCIAPSHTRITNVTTHRFVRNDRRANIIRATVAHTPPALPHPDLESVLFSEEEIKTAVTRLGRQLAADFQDKQPLLLTTLAGAFIFTADLCRAMTPLPPGLQIDFPRASSYGQSAVSSGKVELQFNLLIPIKDRHIILLEDLIDTVGHIEGAATTCVALTIP